ncbi:hypothetical protein A3B51_00955 [Candidatus Curtissbacteria bacterium RIFCSPLOWO2_01_FULL_41_18]|uniref:Type II secretion system protein GspG C-terminal domain-containing protein n=1 Tax=Candidatus Curtissbacteria bacterium RIFCSPLOWO2_01_FULL_41_18 TaxID=1797727 RepID=A0A1F5HN73_9BACT|nr:MAG: hypothetical protein A3B51_00955 [Candidatus Curtissbacteria bacterium RIFCSPLOWO2_01_FULL_41_18]
MPQYSAKCKVQSAKSKKLPNHYALITHHFKVKRAFTLIELLVVISIIALLVAGATVSWTNAQRKSRDAKRKSDFKSVQTALELYFQTNSKYPDSSGGQIRCNVTGDSNNRAWGAKFSCTPSAGSEIIYMNPLPKETVFTNANEVYYYQGAGSPPTSYTLSAKLENANDPDIAAGTLPCTPQTGRNYCVINP